MRTPRLPIVDRTYAPADLNGLVRFTERRNLVSARVPSHFKRSLLLVTLLAPRVLTGYWKICVPLYITILHTRFYVILFYFLSSDRHINA